MEQFQPRNDRQFPKFKNTLVKRLSSVRSVFCVFLENFIILIVYKCGKKYHFEKSSEIVLKKPLVESQNHVINTFFLVKKRKLPVAEAIIVTNFLLLS